MSNIIDEKPKISNQVAKAGKKQIAKAGKHQVPKAIAKINEQQLARISEQQLAKIPKTTGYKVPPVPFRFKPGQTGNPGGRPLGSKNKLPAFGRENLKGSLRQELSKLVTVLNGERKDVMSGFPAIFRIMIDKALSGDVRAATLLISMEQEFESKEKEFYERFSTRAMIFIRLWEEEVKKAKSIDRLIHPPFPFDHLRVNRATGLVEIHGPIPFEHLDRIKVNTATGQVIRDGDGWNLDYVEDPMAIARWFMACMELPAGKVWEHYLR